MAPVVLPDVFTTLMASSGKSDAKYSLAAFSGSLDLSYALAASSSLPSDSLAYNFHISLL